LSLRQKSEGQGLIEFAILLPVLLLLIIGALDLGRVIQMHIVVTNAAREGAYYLSYVENNDNQNCDASNRCFLHTIAAVQAEGNNSGVTIAPANVTVTGCTGGASVVPCQNGTTVAVTVTQQVQLNIFRFFSGLHQITHTVRMVVQ
jgi:Flp pilus assembly protein TadG